MKLARFTLVLSVLAIDVRQWLDDTRFNAWCWWTSPRGEWRNLKERVCWIVARRMPGPFRYYATVLSCGEATSGQWGNEHPGSVGMMEMLKRIERHSIPFA